MCGTRNVFLNAIIFYFIISEKKTQQLKVSSSKRKNDTLDAFQTIVDISDILMSPSTIIARHKPEPWKLRHCGDEMKNFRAPAVSLCSRVFNVKVETATWSGLRGDETFSTAAEPNAGRGGGVRRDEWIIHARSLSYWKRLRSTTFYSSRGHSNFFCFPPHSRRFIRVKSSRSSKNVKALIKRAGKPKFYASSSRRPSTASCWHVW